MKDAFEGLEEKRLIQRIQIVEGRMPIELAGLSCFFFVKSKSTLEQVIRQIA